VGGGRMLSSYEDGRARDRLALLQETGMNWKIVEIPELRGYVVEWAEPGNYLLSRRNSLFRSADLQPPFEHPADFPAPSWRSTLARARLAQRLLRFSVNVVLPLSNGDTFVSFDKSIGVLRNGRMTALRGLRRPCRILRSGAASATDASVYFGEYFGNSDKSEVNVYRYAPGADSVEVVYTFPAGTARHVHGTYFDPFDGSLVCLTGDADHECRMIRSRDGFDTVEIIGEGDESWRAVSILFTEDAMYYGTDAEFRSNTIYRLDRGTGEREELGEVSGTVFYSQRFQGELFFTTTAENAPSQKENVAAIWNVDKEGKLIELAKFQKDLWHTSLFGFGTVYFPHASSVSDRSFFSVYATENDGRTFEIVNRSP
ncbi:MAG TPA: hypothetical protein VFZ49_10070, partial [Pyrinomonadaceae bacterium]